MSDASEVLKLFASLIGTTTFGLVWQKWCKGHFDPPTHHVTHTSTTHGSHNTSIYVLPFDGQQLQVLRIFPLVSPFKLSAHAIYLCFTTAKHLL